jgi:hypothetical protein
MGDEITSRKGADQEELRKASGFVNILLDQQERLRKARDEEELDKAPYVPSGEEDKRFGEWSSNVHHLKLELSKMDQKILDSGKMPVAVAMAAFMSCWSAVVLLRKRLAWARFALFSPSIGALGGWGFQVWGEFFGTYDPEEPSFYEKAIKRASDRHDPVFHPPGGETTYDNAERRFFAALAARNPALIDDEVYLGFVRTKWEWENSAMFCALRSTCGYQDQSDLSLVTVARAIGINTFMFLAPVAHILFITAVMLSLYSRLRLFSFTVISRRLKVGHFAVAVAVLSAACSLYAWDTRTYAVGVAALGCAFLSSTHTEIAALVLCAAQFTHAAATL